MKQVLDKRQRDVWQALIDNGICHSKTLHGARILINSWVKKGKFVYPVNGMHRKYSQQMIDDIVKAFGAGGSGYWSVEDYQ